MREVDLSKFSIRTDLVTDIIENNDKALASEDVYTYKDIKVSDIILDEDQAKEINKSAGRYTTIYFNDITDSSNYANLKEVFVKELKKYINKDNVLVIGLGNDKSTPDAVGPKTLDIIKSTKHIYDLYGSLEDGFSIVSKITPGVMGETGIETGDIIYSIVKDVKPSLIIVIDALASGSIERVCKTIQITDTGIYPGSGVGNLRKEISSDVLGVPVIAIGIPTVVDATTIVLDTINFMSKHFSYNLKNKDVLSNKLIPSNMLNYNKYDIPGLNKEEESFFLGAFGSLSNFEKKALILDVLTPVGYNLIVTPKEIDFDILNLSKLIGESINLVLHPFLSTK